MGKKKAELSASEKKGKTLLRMSVPISGKEESDDHSGRLCAKKNHLSLPGKKKNRAQKLVRSLEKEKTSGAIKDDEKGRFLHRENFHGGNKVLLLLGGAL